MAGFTHLHCHTTWSLRDGAIPAEVLPHLAAGLGYDAVAMTDHDALTGAVRFAHAAKDAGVKAIFGAELTLDTTEHVTLIAKDKMGYANLCRLISDAHLSNERDHPVTTFEKIVERAEGLFVLSGCARGEVARLAAAGRIPEAIAAAQRWRAAIGDGYRIEVFDHRGYGHRILRNRLLKVAHEAGIRAVATNDVHYPGAWDAGTHELLHAIKEIVPLSATQAVRQTSEYYFKDPRQMAASFGDVPEVLAESMRIAEACEFELDLGVYHFPNVELPKGESAAGLLARRCYEGAHRRYDVVTRKVEDRLQHELKTIGHMGWPAYFVLVADIVEHTRKVLAIRCACRGSAAGSLVCYVLGISDVDPVGYDLLFERFMNTRREELPDIDVDVESHRREEVLAHILDTYGSDQVAMCCMVDTFRARMAIREVGKVLGLPPEEIDLVAKAFPRVRAKDIPAAIERLPELSGSNLDAGQLTQLFELCMAIDGFPRHLAVHPSGVILSAPDLADRVPMQESFQGFTMLQADKDDVEELGLPKLDILGVRMFSAIAHASDEIERTDGVRHHLEAMPRDDRATFDLIRSSKTLGCFQIESPGQRELLARFLPSRFEDLLIDISLFRPGPVKSDMVSPFLDRRHGFAETTYAHPSLEPILKETNGVVVYHEQVIRVIAAVTGCSLDDADYVRRHLDAERPADDVANWFVASAIRNGFPEAQAKALWKEVFAFASFGFCKSHAAAFALPTFISAWLKAHYPAHFFAGVLTHDPGMYPRRLIVADARHFGIPILPIDINSSGATYCVEEVSRAAEASRRGACEAHPVPQEENDARDAPRQQADAVQASPVAGPPREDSGRRGHPVYGIRLSLSEVRGISEREVESIVAARLETQFRSLEDLWRRTEVSRPVLENLVHVGALDSVEADRTRRELMWRVVDLCGEPKPIAGTQLSLPLNEPIHSELPALPPYTPLEETQAEIEISGIDARRHVMDLYMPLLVELGCTPANHLASLRNNSEVWVAGVKVASQTPAIRSGQRIIFVTIDDLTGPIDVTIFERVQARCARTVFHSWLQLYRGVVRKRGGASRFHVTDSNNVGITVVVNEAFDLAELAKDRTAGHSVAAALGRQRRKQALTGLRPDREPSGRLWHASGGSAGR